MARFGGSEDEIAAMLWRLCLESADPADTAAGRPYSALRQLEEGSRVTIYHEHRCEIIEPAWTSAQDV